MTAAMLRITTSIATENSADIGSFEPMISPAITAAAPDMPAMPNPGISISTIIKAAPISTSISPPRFQPSSQRLKKSPPDSRSIVFSSIFLPLFHVMNGVKGRLL